MTKIMTLAIPLALVLITGCGPGVISQGDVATASYPVVLLDEVPDEVRARAEAFLSGIRGTEMAPLWNQQAQLDYEVRPMRRPDLEGVAYYEFGVSPGGFIVMSSGDHDFDFPHWSFDGQRPTDILLAEAGAQTVVSGFYKLDSATYVADDAFDNIVSRLGALPPRLPAELNADDSVYSTVVSISNMNGQPVEEVNSYREFQTEQGLVRELTFEDQGRLDRIPFQSWPTWKTLKAGYADNYRAHLDQLTQHQKTPKTPRIAGNAPGGNQSLLVPRAYWVRLASDLQTGLNYSQFSCCGCLSGCGPTAWTIVMAHLSLLGQAGYSPCGEQAFSGPVPSYNNQAVETTVRSIRDRVGTYCLDGLGATSPWRMEDVSAYLNHCYVYYTLQADYSLTGARDSLRDHVIDTVVKKRRPSVIGTGFYAHYAVVAGYGTTFSGSRYFWVNNGWGGSGNGWIPAQTWFYGDVYTRGCINPAPGDDDGCNPGYKCCLPGPGDTCAQCIPDSNHCL